MKIVRLKSCAARENPNHHENRKKLMVELGLNDIGIEANSSKIGKDWASVIFETDTGDVLHVDLTYGENGNLGISVILASHSDQSTHYSKYLEMDCSTGSVVNES